MFRSEPFLWIHLAGLAVVPLSLQLVWLGLAVSDPLPWFWIELLGVGIIGIIPILWMQLTRPFDIFSLLFIAIKPENLTLDQQKILSLFTRKSQKVLALLTAVFMAWIFWLLYQSAPLAMSVASSLPQLRIVGLLIATVGLFISNLFIQVPISVLGVLLTSEDKFNLIESLSPEKIRAGFTIFGFKVRKILPS